MSGWIDKQLEGWMSELIHRWKKHNITAHQPLSHSSPSFPLLAIHTMERPWEQGYSQRVRTVHLANQIRIELCSSILFIYSVHLLGDT